MMRALCKVACALLLFSATLHSQTKLSENFETSDSTHLPTGWTTWNEATFLPFDSTALWTVQDTGLVIPGIVDTRRTVAHSLTKAIRASWYCGLDSSGNILGTADDWLITRRIQSIEATDSLRFWAIGGNGGTTGTYYTDTLEIWLTDVDSLPSSQQFMLDRITWQNGSSLYGVFQKYTYPLDIAAGLDLFIGFRYHTSVEVDGYCVFLDDIEVGGPLTGVRSPNSLPDEISLSQNYPNPFNPTTTIVWTVPSASKVTLKIYNMLGQAIGTLVDGNMNAGEFRTTWDASGYPTGTYFYQLQVGSSVQTRKLVLVK